MYTDRWNPFAPGFANWFAIHAPAKTPDTIVNRINREVEAGLADPDVRARLQKAGATPAKPVKPRQIDADMTADVARFQKLARDNNLKKQ